MDSIGFFNNSLINHITLSSALEDYSSAKFLMETGDFEEFSREEVTAILVNCDSIVKLAYCYPGVGLA